jgi:hypothetical protein
VVVEYGGLWASRTAVRGSTGAERRRPGEESTEGEQEKTTRREDSERALGRGESRGRKRHTGMIAGEEDRQTNVTNKG